MLEKCAVFLGMALSLAWVSPAGAASCTEGGPAKNKRIVDTFIVRPESILELSPQGGIDLEVRVRSLVEADTQITPPIILKLLTRANSSQSSAMSRGYAQAVKTCNLKDVFIGRQLIELARGANNRDLNVAIANALNAPQPSTAQTPDTSNDKRGVMGNPFKAPGNPFAKPALPGPKI